MLTAYPSTSHPKPSDWSESWKKVLSQSVYSVYPNAQVEYPLARDIRTCGQPWNIAVWPLAYLMAPFFGRSSLEACRLFLEKKGWFSYKKKTNEVNFEVLFWAQVNHPSGCPIFLSLALPPLIHTYNSFFALNDRIIMLSIESPGTTGCDLLQRPSGSESHLASTSGDDQSVNEEQADEKQHLGSSPFVQKKSRQFATRARRFGYLVGVCALITPRLHSYYGCSP